MFLRHFFRDIFPTASREQARWLRRWDRTAAIIEGLEPRTLLMAFSEFIDPHPAPGNEFGETVIPLSTGNVLVTSPFDDAGGDNAGAVYLFNGQTGQLISTLIGTHPSDVIGFGDSNGYPGVTVLSNGNFLVSSPKWDNGSVVDAGAVTWGSGVTGISGQVSAANSLVGTSANDEVGNGDTFGYGGLTALSNGNYVVRSAVWDNGVVVDAGAVTWGNGTTGISGPVSANNSLVGSSNSDRLGYDGVMPLINGNYVVASPYWRNGGVANAGAATWGSGTSGVTGLVTIANSLIGDKADDFVSANVYGGIISLYNGNYVVNSSSWGRGAVADVGAVTWGSGTVGVKGVVSAANSLVGSVANDRVGDGGVRALNNGNYVVVSRTWDNGGSSDAGAVTWSSGVSGLVGVVSAANSLVGTKSDDMFFGSVTALSNGNYVVISPYWNYGIKISSGAVTWGSGSTGVAGIVSSANSLVGGGTNHKIGCNC